jgi:hypothetical protein
LLTSVTAIDPRGGKIATPRNNVSPFESLVSVRDFLIAFDRRTVAAVASGILS